MTNDVIKYAIKNDYEITNDVINKKINNNFVFPNTPAQLMLDDTCMFMEVVPYLFMTKKFYQFKKKYPSTLTQLVF